MSDESGLVVTIVVIAVVVLLIVWVASKGIIIIHQAEGMVIERFGRFTRVLDSGLNWIVPWVDTPRQFSWQRVEITPDGRVSEKNVTSTRIDLREDVYNFPPQQVYTRDTILLTVNALMYFRIEDIKKSVYEVDDLQGALSNTAQTQLKEVFGRMTFSQALESQAVINEHLGTEFGRLFRGWGIHVERMELLDLRPQAATSDVMKKQMVAERQRRGDFIKAEGQKTSARLVAEGKKMVSINMGLGHQEATRKTSEGEAGAKIEVARAESQSLEIMSRATGSDGGSYSDYLISQRYLDMLRTMIKHGSRKVFLPFETEGLSGIVGQLPNVYGSASARSAKPKKRGGRKAGGFFSSGDDHADLN